VTRTGAALLCDALTQYGARVVFGIPGTQNVELFEALRRNGLRTVLTTSEITAAFMAGAYARVTGEVGIVITIPGPGFALALPGLAEAYLDSAAVLHITGRPAQSSTRRFQLQAIDQAAIARPIVKAVRQVTTVEDLPAALSECWSRALSDEPGPVLLEIASEVLGPDATSLRPATLIRPAAGAAPDALVQRLRRARRPIVFAGQGAIGAAMSLRSWVERSGSPVITTPSARGILPEDHPLAMGFDSLRSSLDAVNELCGTADLILALGCKFSHNGTAGFGLRLTSKKLVHVDASAPVLEANYPASLAVSGDVGAVLKAMLHDPPERAAWNSEEVAHWRDKIRTARPPELPEPRIADVERGSPVELFAALRRALPRDAVLATDSGLHQIMARRYFDVLAPGGLLLPSDFQSMGFGVPAAIAAKLAAPKRTVVAIVGDGGLAMTGMELLTAARENIGVVVIVFNDGYLNQIRLQQLRDYGHAHAVTLGPLDVESFAAAVGATYVKIAGDAETAFRTALGTSGPVIVDVTIGDSRAIRVRGAKSALREAARSALGARLIRWIKRFKR
jgi:acetolactate synthase-1/2/3 large subunit